MDEPTEQEIRDLQHGLLGTKVIKETATAFDNKYHDYNSAYYRCRSRSGRDGRKKPRQLDKKYADLLWRQIGDNDYLHFNGVEDRTTVDRVFQWVKCRHASHKPVFATTYPVADKNFANVAATFDGYTCKDSVYFAKSGIEAKEGSLIANITVMINTSDGSYSFYGFSIEACYLMAPRGQEPTPITKLNDELLQDLLPAKTRARLLQVVNDHLNSFKEKQV